MNSSGDDGVPSGVGPGWGGSGYGPPRGLPTPAEPTPSASAGAPSADELATPATDPPRHATDPADDHSMDGGHRAGGGHRADPTYATLDPSVTSPQPPAAPESPTAHQAQVSPAEAPGHHRFAAPSGGMPPVVPPPPPGHQAPPSGSEPPVSADNGPDSETPRRKSRARVLLPLGVLVLVLVGVYVAIAAYAGDRVPRGTEVAGVAIGGMEPKVAEKHLDRELAGMANEPLRVEVEGQQHQLRPGKAGLALDAEATVDEVHGSFSLNPTRVFHVIFGTHKTDPVPRVDEEQLDQTVVALGKKVDHKPTEGKIAFTKGKVRSTPPKPGLQLERDQAVEQLQESYLSDSGTIALEARTPAPKVPTEEYERALHEFAQPAMSGPISVRAGDDGSFEIGTDELGAALSVRPSKDDPSKLTTNFSGKKLSAAVDDDLSEIGTEPEDATVRLEGGQPTVVPGEKGTTVEPAQLAKSVKKVLTAKGSDRVAQVKAQPKKPDLTTKEAKKLQVKEVVGEFSTNYPHAEYRNTNIGRAAELINGTFLEPDETFSLNDTVGERTEANGFTSGSVIEGGRLVDALGGGVSQVATTTYNAAHFAGMEDVEHRPHAFYIDRYPAGREATVYWGSLDLKFKNNTPYGVLVDAQVDRSSPGGEGTLTVRLWSSKYWDVNSTSSQRHNYRQPDDITDDSEDCVPQSGSPGFDIDITRTLSRNGKVVETETDPVQYQAEDKVTCTNGP